MRDESVIGGGRDFGGYEWLAGLRDDAVASNAVVWTPPLVGAHARTPLE